MPLPSTATAGLFSPTVFLVPLVSFFSFGGSSPPLPSRTPPHVAANRHRQRVTTPLPDPRRIDPPPVSTFVCHHPSLTVLYFSSLKNVASRPSSSSSRHRRRDCHFLPPCRCGSLVFCLFRSHRQQRQQWQHTTTARRHLSRRPAANRRCLSSFFRSGTAICTAPFSFLTSLPSSLSDSISHIFPFNFPYCLSSSLSSILYSSTNKSNSSSPPSANSGRQHFLISCRFSFSLAHSVSSPDFLFLSLFDFYLSLPSLEASRSLSKYPKVPSMNAQGTTS